MISLRTVVAILALKNLFFFQEKWDSMTRKWRDNHSLIRQVSLFLIDEVSAVFFDSFTFVSFVVDFIMLSLAWFLGFSFSDALNIFWEFLHTIHVISSFVAKLHPESSVLSLRLCNSDTYYDITGSNDTLTEINNKFCDCYLLQIY